MALYDSADLLARCKTLANTPQLDEETTDDVWYQLLSDSQVYWAGQMSVHCPTALFEAPEAMTTNDGGATYSISREALGTIEVYQYLNGPRLSLGAWQNGDADYTQEGPSTIRATRPGSLRQVPYARYVAMPGAIDAATAPSIKPSAVRQLLVYRAVANWALRGGLRDPSPYFMLEEQNAWGDPRTGAQGIITTLKLQQQAYNTPSGGGDIPWYRRF